MTSEIVRSGRRGLHFRKFGEGRPVVLLHESPRSIAALIPLATELATQGFTVYAVDSPGYGLSDPLPMSWPEIEDFADAIVDSLKAAGLVNVPVYGTHTGATIAAAMGARHPDFVSGVILDGYPVFDRTERDQHESFYLRQFPPAWDGSHIVALWARVRDQYEFFPWYTRGASARLKTARPDLARHRAVFHDFLRSGSAYALAYAASFRFEAAAWLSRLEMPFHVIARDTDLLHAHLDRLPELPKWGASSSCHAAVDAWASRVGEIFATMPGQATAPNEIGPQYDSEGSLYSVRDGLFLRNYGEGRENTLVLLHDIPGSAILVADEARRRSRNGLVITPELPGCGISGSPASGEAGLQHFILELEQALDASGVAMAAIEGEGEAGALANAISARSSRLNFQERGLPSVPAAITGDDPLQARWDGADLLAMWYEVREKELARARLRGGVAGLDLERMHAIFVARCLSHGETCLLSA